VGNEVVEVRARPRRVSESGCWAPIPLVRVPPAQVRHIPPQLDVVTAPGHPVSEKKCASFEVEEDEMDEVE
jgi:hypothetical protein